MTPENFANIFAELSLPVLLCKNTPDMPIVYMNVRAGLMFTPTHSVDQLTRGGASLGNLADVLDFGSGEEMASFARMLNSTGHIDSYATRAVTFESEKLPVLVVANTIACEDEDDHAVLYLVQQAGRDSDATGYDARLASIISDTYLTGDVNESIQTVLALAGQHIGASRVYIFEEITPTTTRNTYEWCAEGVEPAIQDLQDLKKADYNYDVIISSRMYITNDVRELPGEDRQILEAQGIKALAIIPFYDGAKALGYVGFDDTARYHEWSYDEIRFLQSISILLASLIKRRNAEQGTRRSLEMLQILLDNSEDVIYANSLEDYSLLFVSRSLADSLGKTREELLGKPCWSVLQSGQNGPCSFCPIPHITVEPGAERSPVYEWELKNSITRKTYLAKDSIVRWVDGQYVHVETATDISQRKEYEEQLQYYASIDGMTGVMNREWGAKTLAEMLARPGARGSLCFLDLDGLKKTNDRFGHDTGDEFLLQTVKLLRSYLGGEEFVCRWGGDEFLVWMDSDTKEAAHRLAEVQKAMREYNNLSGKPFQLSFSYGVVPFTPGPATTLDTLVTAADELMYRDKMEKRGKLLGRRRGD